MFKNKINSILKRFNSLTLKLIKMLLKFYSKNKNKFNKSKEEKKKSDLKFNNLENSRLIIVKNQDKIL